jgi:hypothetical protein
LNKKLSDVYTKEEAERIAREAIEQGIASEREAFDKSHEEDAEFPTSAPKIDYSRVIQEEFKRSESTGTDLDRDREFTQEDFGDEVPEDLKQEESFDDEKPTVEVYSDSGVPIMELSPTISTEIQISKSPDDELADYQIIEKYDVGEEVVGSGGLGIEEPTIRPHSPVPPRWQPTSEMAESGPSTSVEIPESGPPSAEPSLVTSQKADDMPQRKSDDGSESSLQEFERIELEITKVAQPQGSPVSVHDEEMVEMVASATGSLNSLTEFENVERAILGEFLRDNFL